MMLIQADGVVTSITPAGYVDHFDTGQVAVFDTMMIDVHPDAGREPAHLRIILDGPDRERWQVGLRVCFEIDEQDLDAPGPVFEGTLRSVRERRPG
jgi:hypothetical protein